MYKVKETFEYLVNDPNNFCSIHDALEWVQVCLVLVGREVKFL